MKKTSESIGRLHLLNSSSTDSVSYEGIRCNCIKSSITDCLKVSFASLPGSLITLLFIPMYETCINDYVTLIELIQDLKCRVDFDDY